MQNKELAEELLEKIHLTAGCAECGEDECICAHQHAASGNADVRLEKLSQISTVDDVREAKLDSSQDHGQVANENQTSRETAESRRNRGSQIQSSVALWTITFRSLLSILVLEFLDDRTLLGACLALCAIMLSLATSISNHNYDQIKSIVDPTFRAIAMFMAAREIACWFIRRSLSQATKKTTMLESISLAPRYLLNFAMITLVLVSIVLGLIFPCLLMGSHFVWTFGGYSCATLVFLSTAVAIVAVIVQEIAIYLRPLPGKNAADTASWKTRCMVHVKTFFKISEVSYTAWLTITGALMLIFWSDLIWLTSATVAAQSLREHDPSRAAAWAESLEKNSDRAHAADSSYLIALADIALGKEDQAETHLDQAVSDLRSRPDQKLEMAVLNAKAELARRHRIRQKMNQQSQDSQNEKSDLESHTSYNLKYGPFELNLQMKVDE